VPDDAGQVIPGTASALKAPLAPQRTEFPAVAADEREAANWAITCFYRLPPIANRLPPIAKNEKYELRKCA